MFRSQKEFEIQLEQLKSFSSPSVKLEQYPTPAKIAAEWMWGMALRGEVQGKIVLDAGCGGGILGIGALLLGAKKVFFVDKDETALEIAKENYNAVKKEYKVGKAEFFCVDITQFAQKVDVVVQNPPFGTKEAHADKKFLEKAFSLAPVVYSMHKSSTKKFVEAISKDFGFWITHHWEYAFPIKAVFKFHEKPVKRIEVGLWKMEKKRMIL
ncbi:MAG: METTL5 family protein [Nanoarchaeota archaeon]